jgi:hypothetical protein
VRVDVTTPDLRERQSERRSQRTDEVALGRVPELDQRLGERAAGAREARLRVLQLLRGQHPLCHQDVAQSGHLVVLSAVGRWFAWGQTTTRPISSIVVLPSSTFARPSSRSGRIPCSIATRVTSSEEARATVSRSISSVTVITSWTASRPR